MSTNATADALSAAVETLGSIAHALAGRRLLAAMNAAPDRREAESTIRAELEAQALADLQLEELAGDAQEAAALVLAEAGVAGYSVRTCDGGIGSAEYERYMETQRKD